MIRADEEAGRSFDEVVELAFNEVDQSSLYLIEEAIESSADRTHEATKSSQDEVGLIDKFHAGNVREISNSWSL